MTVGMMVSVAGTTTVRRACAETLTRPATVRLMFDAPVSQIANRDPERLWVVSRGRLFELDFCLEGPREIRLEIRSDDTNERGRGRRLHGDAEEALMLASLDEATQDESVLEDFLDEEGLRSDDPGNTRRRTRLRSPRQEVVDLKRDQDGGLWVITAGGRGPHGRSFRCETGTASCKPRDPLEPVGSFDAPRLPPPAPPTPEPEIAGEPVELTEETGPLFERYDVPEGAWLSSSRGVWFALRDRAAWASRCAYLTESRGSGDDLTSNSSRLLPSPSTSLAPLPWSVFLPRVSLVAAHATRSPGKSESLMMLLLAFSPGRAVGRGAMPAPLRPTAAPSSMEPLP